MTLHLRRIHCADHARADVRVSQRIEAETTDQLRDELADRLPLRWPINLNRRTQFTHQGERHDQT